MLLLNVSPSGNKDDYYYYYFFKQEVTEVVSLCKNGTKNGNIAIYFTITSVLLFRLLRERLAEKPSGRN